MIILQRTSRAEKARRRISRTFTATHHTLERQAVRSLQVFYGDVAKSVLRRLKRAGTGADVDELFLPSEWRRPFVSRFHRHWNAAVWTGVEFEAAWSASQQPEKQAARLVRQDVVGGVDTEFPAPPPSIHVEVSPELQRQVRDWLQERRAGVWNRVGRTTRDRIRRSLQAGLRDGDTLNELQARMRGTMKSLSGVQARRIARTETTGSMSFGGQAERDELGIELKEWVSTIDRRNRGVDPKSPWDHLTPNGQKRKNAEPFLVSGEPLMFPGDSAGSAGNVINCRCSAVGAWDD